jgi:thiol:disulfide interchange protein DsbA
MLCLRIFSNSCEENLRGKVMLKKAHIGLVGLLLSLLLSVSQMAYATFQEGKDYLRLPTPIVEPSLAPGKVLVTEFFNYGCPACFHLEPALEQWLKKKPANVKFERVPVVFHAEWLNYAKTYYVLSNMGIEAKMTPIIFAAIHKQGLDLSQESNMLNFLSTQGVNIAEFKSTYSFSPGIQAQLNKAEEKMRSYLVNETLVKKSNWVPQIPTLAVNGKYLVSGGLVDGNNEKLFQVLAMLIKKESTRK